MSPRPEAAGCSSSDSCCKPARRACRCLRSAARPKVRARGWRSCSGASLQKDPHDLSRPRRWDDLRSASPAAAMPASLATSPLRRFLALGACTAAFLLPIVAGAAPVAAIQDLARQEQQPLLDTLRDLVSIE